MENIIFSAVDKRHHIRCYQLFCHYILYEGGHDVSLRYINSAAPYSIEQLIKHCLELVHWDVFGLIHNKLQQHWIQTLTNYKDYYFVTTG